MAGFGRHSQRYHRICFWQYSRHRGAAGTRQRVPATVHCSTADISRRGDAVQREREDRPAGAKGTSRNIATDKLRLKLSSALRPRYLDLAIMELISSAPTPRGLSSTRLPAR